MSRASNLAGFVSAIYPEDNLSVGFLTARNLNVIGITTFGGTLDVQGGVSYAQVAGVATVATVATTATNAQGLTGTPDITVGQVNATSFIGPLDGNATGLTGTPDIAVGNIIASGDVSVGGTLTYEDVTDIDAVGLVTARGGIEIGPLTGIAATISAAGIATFQSGEVVGQWLMASNGAVWANTSDPGVMIQTNGANGSLINIKTNGAYADSNVLQVLKDGFQGQNLRASIGGEGGAMFANDQVNIHTHGGANFAGVVTASSFSGDGSGLTGVESWNQLDTWLYSGT